MTREPDPWATDMDDRLEDVLAEVERLKEVVASLQASSGYEASIAQAEIERLRCLVQCLLDEDPNDLAADGGVTVLDVWRKEARAALEPKP